jgi:aminopeptidase-like protein
LELPNGLYEVVVDTRLFPGSLSYGEVFFPGDTEEEVLFSAHLCHPSLANDNLSGVVVATALAQYLGSLPRHRYGYRFVFAPATIGAIAWLSRNEANISRIRHGLTLALLGDAGALTYKQSRLGTASIDRIMEHVLSHTRPKGTVREFVPYGYDERQYCSPGIDIPMGCLMRTPNGEFPEYHTSADNLDFISAESLEASLKTCLRVIEILESDRICLNLAPKGEPRLGKRGLYSGLKGAERPPLEEMALFWVLSFSDGKHSLLAIAERAKLPFAAISAAAAALENCGLIITA